MRFDRLSPQSKGNLAEHGGTLYVFSENTAGKIKRIRANGRALFAACNFNGQVIKSGWVESTARVVEDQSEIDSMYREFVRKYGLIMIVTNFLARLSGRFERRAIIAINIPTH